MTVLAGGPAADTVAIARPAATASGLDEVPSRVEGTALLGKQPGSGYVVPPALVRRGDGQVLQLTPLLYAVLEAIDGTRGLDAVAAVASAACGRTLVADDVRTLVDAKLRPLGLVHRRDGSQAEVAKASPLLALRPRLVVSNPRITRRVTAPFALLFHPLIAAPVVVAFAAIAFWVLFEQGLGAAAYQAFENPGLLLAVFAITLVSAGFHEFGHAAALRRGGGTPGVMGAGLYLIWPAFFTDVTDSYRLGRGARIRVDLGGLYFNALVTVVTFGMWELVRWDALLLVIAAQIVQMIRQLPPLVRFDGYHLLADITGGPDLFHRIGPTLRSFGPRRWRKPGAQALRPWVRVVVTAWVLVVVPLLAASLVVAVVALPRMLASTGHAVALQAGLLSRSWRHGNDVQVVLRALGILAVIVPVGGLLLMLGRASRSYSTRVWRATAGRPRGRAGAVLTMAALVAGLLVAWWPHGTYRPIQPWERGTVSDALPAAVTGGLVPGAERVTRTIWADDGQPLPTAEHPALAVVLTPRSGHGPTWVFPFNRPTDPTAGGNQAMAIVTRDGGTVYDAAFALVWVRNGISLNRNEAYAFASCHRCRAVAVGFQVVMVVGQSRLVAPQNIAAAVSYRCIDCVTEALARQLIVTVPHELTPQQLRALHRVWRDALTLSHHLRRLTFAQLESRIRTFEREIDAIVNVGTTSSLPTAPSATPVATQPTTTTAPSTAATAAATASGSATPEASTSTASSPSTSTSADSASPSPSSSGTTSSSTSPSPSASSTP